MTETENLSVHSIQTIWERIIMPLTRYRSTRRRSMKTRRFYTGTEKLM